MSERFKSVVTVGIILINEKEEVLLQKRTNTGYMDGMYALVSGHLEEHESMISGIIREVKEEINLDLKEKNILIRIGTKKMVIGKSGIISVINSGINQVILIKLRIFKN